MKQIIVVMRKYCWLSLLLLLSAAGCAYGENRRLGAGITVDGADVSRMRIHQARAVLEAEQRRRLEGFVCGLSYEDQQVFLGADALGVSADIEGALRQCAKIRAMDSERNVRVAWNWNETALNRAVNSVANAIDSPPVNATAVFGAKEVLFAYTPEASGCQVDTAALKAMLVGAVEQKQSCSIGVPCIQLRPRRTVEQLRLQRTLLSCYTTSFAGASLNGRNRVYNITKAASLLHGTVLEPGEVFDCNQRLGDRNQANGWKEAAGISYGTYVQEYGGGVCQVSSTLFNAVLMADLEVVERSPHSWPMKYVPIGRDATISTGGKNFRFRNSSRGRVYLSVTVSQDEKTITASVYGQALSDGVHITVTSELVELLEEPATEVQLDESLPADSQVMVRQPRRGKVSRTYKEYRRADGSLIRRELAYEDTYRSIDGILTVSADRYYTDNYS